MKTNQQLIETARQAYDESAVTQAKSVIAYGNKVLAFESALLSKVGNK